MKLYCLLLSLLLLSACAAAPTPTASLTPASTVTDTPSPATPLTAIPVRATDNRPTAPSIRDVTFPPPFTATPTYTATLSPTMTNTPSPTQTLTTSERCELFTAETRQTSGTTYRSGDVILFRLNTQGTTDVSIQLLLNHMGSDTEFNLEFPGGEQVIMTINPVDFDTTGAYTWRATLSTENDSGLCLRTGSFVIDLSEATPELTEEATAEMTEAVRIITATPLILIVTATPEATAETTAESTAEATEEVTEEITDTPDAD